MNWLEIINICLIAWFVILVIAGILFLLLTKFRTPSAVISIFDIIAIFLLFCMKPYMLLGLILSILHFVLKFY